jgi:AraC-like DNA-binding protein
VKGASILSEFAMLPLSALDPDVAARTVAIYLGDENAGRSGGRRARLASCDVMRLWDSAARASGDPNFGLGLGAAIQPRALGVLGYLLVSSATLGQAFERCRRYRRLLDTASFEMSIEDGQAWFRFRPATTRHYSEAIVGSTVALVRQAVGLAVRPALVTFEHAQPRSIAAHRSFFGVTPEFGRRGGSRVAFDAALLALPCVKADPDLAAHLESAAQGALLELPSDAPVIDAARSAILASIAQSRDASAAAIARGLGMTTRTLHRRLSAHETTFRALLERTRMVVAERLLHDLDLTAEQIALRVGFSDGTAFSRAFRRWSRRSPRAFRASLGK